MHTLPPSFHGSETKARFVASWITRWFYVKLYNTAETHTQTEDAVDTDVITPPVLNTAASNPAVVQK